MDRIDQAIAQARAEGKYAVRLTRANRPRIWKPESFFAPSCRCGSRNTARIGESALTRQCQACGQTYTYRLKDGLLVPLTLTTALAMEGK